MQPVTVMKLAYLPVESYMVADVVRRSDELSPQRHQLQFHSVPLRQATLLSLQVFASQFHPSLIKGPGREKEGARERFIQALWLLTLHARWLGFSLFALLDNAQHVCGRRRLREWMLRPILDIDILSQRHEAIEALVMPHNAEIVAQIQRELRGVKDIDKCVNLPGADS